MFLLFLRPIQTSKLWLACLRLFHFFLFFCWHKKSKKNQKIERKKKKEKKKKKPPRNTSRDGFKKFLRKKLQEIVQQLRPKKKDLKPGPLKSHSAFRRLTCLFWSGKDESLSLSHPLIFSRVCWVQDQFSLPKEKTQKTCSTILRHWILHGTS